AYFDAQRDSSPDAPRRYADSLLFVPGAGTESSDWGGSFSPSWSMVPTTSNTFGVAMRAVPAAMGDIGTDGLYWDEMYAADYAAPRVTARVWRGHTCDLSATGTVERRVGLVNLLSEEAKLAYADGCFVLGNSPPTTRSFQARPDVRMVEAQHDNEHG